MGGRKNGDKGGGESDVDDHHFSVVSTKLLGALALVAVIIGIGIGKFECLPCIYYKIYQVWFPCKLTIISLCYTCTPCSLICITC